MWNLLQEVPPLRQLEFGQMSAHPVIQPLYMFVAGRLQDHCDSDVFAVELLLVTESANLECLLILFRDRVDIAGVNLHPASVDLFALSTAQIQNAAIIDQTNVASEKPALRYNLVGQVITP